MPFPESWSVRLKSLPRISAISSPIEPVASMTQRMSTWGRAGGEEAVMQTVTVSPGATWSGETLWRMETGEAASAAVANERHRRATPPRRTA